MNDALTDLVRDMNKFRGQVEKKRLNDEDNNNLLQINYSFYNKDKTDICCSLEKQGTSRANPMRR